MKTADPISYTVAIAEPVGTDAVYTAVGHAESDLLTVTHVIPGSTHQVSNMAATWADQFTVAAGTSDDKVWEVAQDFAQRLSAALHGRQTPRFKDPLTGISHTASRTKKGKVVPYFDRETAMAVLSRDGLYQVSTRPNMLVARPTSLADFYAPGDHAAVHVVADEEGLYDLSGLGWGLILS